MERDHPYPDFYLEDIRVRLSVLFQYTYDELGFSLSKILLDFADSKIAKGIERGLPYYMLNKSGIELVEVLYPGFTVVEKDVRYGKEYWVGWVLPYLEWYTNMTFKDIISIVPAERFYTMYEPYHEMDISHLFTFADKYILGTVENSSGHKLRQG